MFYKVVYHHIIYGCVFFLVNLDYFFAIVCTGFYEGCGTRYISLIYTLTY